MLFIYREDISQFTIITINHIHLINTHVCFCELQVGYNGFLVKPYVSVGWKLKVGIKASVNVRKQDIDIDGMMQAEGNMKIGADVYYNVEAGAEFGPKQDSDLYDSPVIKFNV